MLVVDYDAESKIKSTINKISNGYGTRVNDYTQISTGVQSTGNSSSRSYLSSASVLIQKKTKDFSEKKANLDSFRQSTTDFFDRAEETDKSVANRIKADTKSFMSDNNIRVNAITTIFVTLKNFNPLADTFLGRLDRYVDHVVSQVVTKIKQGIKDWYHSGGKLWVDLGLTLVGIVVAVITFPVSGVLAITVATFLLASKAITLYYDMKAIFTYYSTDNIVLANRVAQQGISDSVSNATGCVLELTGASIETKRQGQAIAASVTGLLEFAANVYSLGKDVLDFKDAYKTMDGSVLSKTLKSFETVYFKDSRIDGITDLTGIENAFVVNKQLDRIVSFGEKLPLINATTYSGALKLFNLAEMWKRVENIQSLSFIGYENMELKLFNFKDSEFKIRFKLPDIIKEPLDHVATTIENTGKIINSYKKPEISMDNLRAVRINLDLNMGMAW